MRLRDFYDNATQAATGLTLPELAFAKRLPEAFLRSLGCTDGPGPSVRIPYCDKDGTVVAIRTRRAMHGNRFRWRKGDRVLLYGLERLPQIRVGGWLLLVEGESDCWTAWHLGLPALGIPGKGTWRREWAAHTDGLTVFLWQEPDAADLVERVAASLPEASVIVAPPGAKDISEAHVRGEDVVALVERLRSSARTVTELTQERQEAATRKAHEQAISVLDHPDPLELVAAEMRAQGYGGDVRIPLLGYLAMTSRVLALRRGAMLAHTLFMGPSSGGKNAALRAGLDLLPPEAAVVIDAGSPRVLIYDERVLAHRVVVFSEADSLPAGEDNPAASAVRTLLQEGHARYQVTVRDPMTGGFTVRTVERPGPTVLLTTSTKSLGHQLMTRLFTVEVPDEPGQFRAALAAQAAMELDGPVAPDGGLLAIQAYLQARAPIDVVVPFARELSASIGRQPTGPRVLRDFPRLISLIKAVTLLRIAHRSVEARGRIAATIDDYATVRELVGESYEASAGASRRVRDTVEGVAALTARRGEDATVSVSELASRLGISIPATWRRVHDAIAGGWLVNDETRSRQMAKLRIGEPLPSTSLLPTTDELRAMVEEARRASDAVTEVSGLDVCAFAPNPDGSVPPGAVVDDALGGEHRPVRTANAQTAPDGGDWTDVPDAPIETPDRVQPSLWDSR